MAAMIDSSAAEGPVPPLRVLFLGLPGVLAEVVLGGLLARRAAVAAVVVPLGSVPQLVPVSRQALTRIEPPASHLLLAAPAAPRSLPGLAWAANVPLYAAHPMRSPEIPAAVRAIDADVAVVACYAERIPRAVLEIPRHGFLNIHPSLLPKYRGPAPLFWQLRDGVESFGVTVHLMDERFDSGDMAAQSQVAIPDGATGPEADAVLGQAGTTLLLTVLEKLAAGTLQCRPQKGPSSRAPRPSISDFEIPVSWTARHAFNFMRGTEEWNQPYRVESAAGPLTVLAALGCDDRAQLESPFRIDGDQIDIAFSRGVLYATGYREPAP